MKKPGSRGSRGEGLQLLPGGDWLVEQPKWRKVGGILKTGQYASGHSASRPLRVVRFASRKAPESPVSRRHRLNPAYREYRDQLRLSFPQPVSDPVHDAWFGRCVMQAAGAGRRGSRTKHRALERHRRSRVRPGRLPHRRRTDFARTDHAKARRASEWDVCLGHPAGSDQRHPRRRRSPA